jgi:hypothetical protein
MIMIETESISGDFMTLFRGRGDAHGTWEGGCARKQLTEESFWRHLHGVELIGVYPVVPMPEGERCVWGCSDIDVDDLDAALNLQLAFAMKQITAWVEKTRKGYHIWVFTTKTVSAPTMRRAFLAAHQVIDYPPTEVNPKQEELRGGLGNYVRLPYPSALNFDEERVETRFRFMLDANINQMSLHDFVPQALASRATPEQLEAIAELYKAPVTRSVVINNIDSADVEELITSLSGLAYIIWRDGPKVGSDRSLTLYRFTALVKDQGFTPEQCYKLVESADRRWGKFHMRPDPDKEIVRLVTRVYGKAD